MFKLLHTGDLHFSNHIDKLQEVVRTSDFILRSAESDRPDCIVLAGDVLDEYDGRIRIDSDCARAAISFVERAANIAPVVIIRGTRSHDRESPYLFKHLRSRFPVHVASDVEMVALELDPFGIGSFTTAIDANADYAAVFTLVPSLDKAALLGRISVESIKDGNWQFKEAIHDMFAGFGLINQQFSCPTVLVTHGMLTGACFSSGQTAIGEDLEFGLNDLHAAGCDYVALGHVHKHQQWGNVVYSGSPGRLNFGETEDKGFCMVDFAGKVPSMRFIQTPARKFWFGELAWEDGFEASVVTDHVQAHLGEVEGADVRFRYSVPEEYRQQVDRDLIERMFLEAGAARVKIEAQVLPRQRVRAAGISRAETLPEKVVKWADCVGETVPDRVLALASVIEGQDADELLAMAQAAVCGVQPVEVDPAVAVADTYHEEQADLFAGGVL